MSEWKAPATGRHVHVVLRLDHGVLRPDLEIDDLLDAIVGTNAFATREEAATEAARLNEVNANKRSKYFVVAARLRDDASESA
jgi:hypothetical protein